MTAREIRVVENSFERIELEVKRISDVYIREKLLDFIEAEKTVVRTVINKGTQHDYRC